MKKTIALLLATAGFALADVTNVTNQLEWNDDMNVASLNGIESLQKEVTVVLTLNWDAITESKYQDIFIINDSSEKHRLGFGMYDDDEVNLIYSNNKGTGYVGEPGFANVYENISKQEVQDAAFVFTCEPAGGKQMTLSGYLYLWANEDSTPVLVNVTYSREVVMDYDHFTINSNYVKDIEIYAGITDNPELLATNLKNFVPPSTPESPTIPEPTTATLSLLALAGLAARRRRK